jgi:hypothetical protein
MADTVTQLEIDQRVFDLYDEYCHGRIDHREFLRLAALVAGGLAMAQAAAALCRGTDHLVRRHSDQGAVRDLPVARRSAPRRGRGLPTASSRSVATPATTTTAARCRAASTRRSCGPTC